MSTLSIRRSRLERQMALRSTEEFPEGFAVRQGHLAPPLVTPDSPRPQKSEKTAELASTHSLTIPSLQPRQIYFAVQLPQTTNAINEQ
ncbi:hypothetical protein Tcan_14194 [Toxocara canis]|uniref:Uncharacterized protein n=1 Tax=Toxocara canis TaxID=6265 RepID=A0A0B2VUA7_TOXCA|nr:hypothetical protein Tcan_14194 [Toxocara canis]